jgi:hypothetical protein
MWNNSEDTGSFGRMRVGCVGIEVEHLFQQKRLGLRFLRGTIFFSSPRLPKTRTDSRVFGRLTQTSRTLKKKSSHGTTYTGFIVSIYTLPPLIFLLSFVPSLSFSSLSSLLCFFSLVWGYCLLFIDKTRVKEKTYI